MTPNPNQVRPSMRVAAKSEIRMYPDEIIGRTDEEIKSILEYKTRSAYNGMLGHIKSFKNRGKLSP